RGWCSTRRRATGPSTTANDLCRVRFGAGAWRAAAAAAPSPLRLRAQFPLPYRERGANAVVAGPAVEVAKHDVARPVRNCAGAWAFNLSRYGRGGEPKRAGEGAEAA